MKIPTSQLAIPVYLKTDAAMPWPKDEPVFHLLTGDGLFICRNHPFFRSSSPVRTGPAELAGHQPFLDLKYPKIPRDLFETIVGFFDRIGMEHGAESAVLFAWNRETQTVELVVPPQQAMVGHDWKGRPFPLNVCYDVPELPEELILFGDAHCHVDGYASASKTDVDDEAGRPGLHIIVGRIHREPPEIRVDVTVDGSRFHVRNHQAVIGGYRKRRYDNIPAEWIARVEVIPWKRNYSTWNTDDPDT